METDMQPGSLPGLATRALGRVLHRLYTVDSTNLEVRRRLAAGEPDGFAVVAGEQTAGRGRRGRQWVSETGCGLWLSLAVRPQVPAGELQKLTLLTAAAVSAALARCTGGALRPVIKWPNDILAGAGGGKLCGILCESVVSGDGPQCAVVGIGVNTRTPAGGWGGGVRAASVEGASGVPVCPDRLAAEILNGMEALVDRWGAEGFGPVAGMYRQWMLAPGSAVRFGEGDAAREGLIEGLDEGGGLLIRLGNGDVARVISGEISVRGVEGNV